MVYNVGVSWLLQRNCRFIEETATIRRKVVSDNFYDFSQLQCADSLVTLGVGNALTQETSILQIFNNLLILQNIFNRFALVSKSYIKRMC